MNGRERRPAAAVQEGLDFCNDRQRDSLGCASAEIESNGGIEPGSQASGTITEFCCESFAASRRPQQSNVCHVTFCENREVATIGREVMTHHHSSIDLLQIDFFAECRNVHFDDSAMRRKPSGIHIRGAMIDDSDLPAKPRGELGDRLRIRARATQQQRRRVLGRYREYLATTVQRFDPPCSCSAFGEALRAYGFER